MKDISAEDFSNEIFELIKDTIYEVLEKFEEKQNIDKTLTYIFIKAFYIHVVKMVLVKQNTNKNNRVYREIKVEQEWLIERSKYTENKKVF